MSDEIRPAIHAMWWKEIIPRIAAGDGWVPLLSDYAGVKNSEGHAAAALALYGQPFGFTADDVEIVRRFADGCDGTLGAADDYRVFPDGIVMYMMYMRDVRRLASLADRIAALLPP